MSTPRACLGDDVLYRRFLRDAWLGLADSKAALFRPVWDTSILGGLQRELYNGGGYSKDQAADIVDALRSRWPDSVVSAPAELTTRFRPLVGPYAELFAAAVGAGADTLVTNHPGDFPESVCEPNHIVSRSPDHFLRELFFSDPRRLVQILSRTVAEYTEGLTFADFLKGLYFAGVEEFIYVLLDYRSMIDLEALTDEWRSELNRG